ncbi:hypothetical protein HDN1F_37820 [gamma proteobacterium HdN1]|nr:hypothetical protein HDN1F_37820 [gamma proteobacterium HdN1]
MRFRPESIALIALLGASTLLCAQRLHAETTIKIPRENGALHQEFRNLLANKIKEFKTGVGRMSLLGNADKGSCVANFFINTDTTFVTMEISKAHYYTEFYIDHPTQSFRNVLFQSLLLGDDGAELTVTKRDGDYSIQTDGQQLILSTRAPRAKDPIRCTFDLSTAQMFDGETE